MDTETKYQLITQNLQEVLGDEQEIKTLLETRPLKIYWGTAPTGRIHIGYFIPLLKIADFLDVGCEVKVLIADLHAFLDDGKSPMEKLEKRSEYYEQVIKCMLMALNVDISQLTFVRGTEFQLSKEYTLDVYRLGSVTSDRNAKHAGAEVVKTSSNPMMTSMLYPSLQALDEQYLDVDAQFGGVDQRKIFAYAREFLPKLGYKKRFHLMNPMLPSLSGEQNAKMSASDTKFKIDICDTAKQVKKKVNKGFCEPGNVENNGILVALKYILFPILNRTNSPFIIDRPDKYGGPLIYPQYEQVEQDFADGNLHPADLKMGVSSGLANLVTSVHDNDPENKIGALIQEAYE